MRFNATALSKGFDKIQKESRRQGELMMRQAGRQFVMRTRRESWESVATTDEIIAIGDRLGWRMIFRGNSRNPSQETRRRVRARKTFARGWRFWYIWVQPNRIQIWIKNTVAYAGLIEQRDQRTVTAGQYIGGRFQRQLAAITRKINQAWKADTSGQYL